MTVGSIRPDIALATLLVNDGDIVYDTERTEVFRARLADGSANLICKRPRGPGALRRLRREAVVLDRLAGVDGVLRVVAGYADESILVFADTGGTSLAEVLQSGPLAPDRLVDTAVKLASVLAGVHGRGVVHQDVNPANIVIDGSFAALWLIDYELATTSAEERRGFSHQSEITGTLPYLAPEQTGRTGWPVDHRADLYCVGSTLYEMATGEPPFGSGELMQLVHDHLARVPVSPSARNPAVPDGLARIILRLLEKEPDKRYQSADGLLHDLSRLRTEIAAGGDGVFALGARDFPVRLAPPSQLIGRSAEIGQLRAALAEVTGGRGRGLLVTGPPGVGKTALIDELRSSVTAAGGWFVTGKFDQYRQDRESDAARQALRGLGRLLLAEPTAELAAHRARIADALGANAGLITAVLPEFASIVDAPPIDLEAETTAAYEGRLIQASLDLLRAVVTPDRPLVMVLDDLQWAASTPIGLVDAVMLDDNLPGVLLLGTYRDNEVDAVHPLAPKLARWERLDAPPTVLRLRNLPPADLALMLAEMLRLPPAEAAALAQAVGPRTAGNPFDTVELVNAMRTDGTLVSGPEGWRWDPEAVRRYVGKSDVLGLLAARIDLLPDDSRSLLEIMACIGGQLNMNLLPLATGKPATWVEAALEPPLEDGLLVVERDSDVSVRFRHDRVQQAAHLYRDPADRQLLRLTLGRRFADRPELSAMAAEQYLAAADAVTEPDERRRAVALMRIAGSSTRLNNPALAEEFLAAAVALLSPVQSAADAPLLIALGIERHAVLCSLGRLVEADEVYDSMVLRQPPPLDLAGAACTQISSLSNRNMQAEAVALGVQVLRLLGCVIPPAEELTLALDRGLDAVHEWAAAEDGLTADLDRPPVTNQTVLALGDVINRMLPPAFFSGHPLFGWLVCQAQQLWVEHGPAASLVGPLSHAPFATNPVRGDFRTGYRVARRILAVSEARGYVPHDSQSRFLFALGGSPWFDPAEETVRQAMEARGGLQRHGDLQNAVATYWASLPQLLDCAPDLDSYSAEAESAVAAAGRIGDDHGGMGFLAYRQLAKALRGETERPGSFGDASLDEAAYFAGMAANPNGGVHAHSLRGLSAALFDDAAGLTTHAAAVMALLHFTPSIYNVALAHFLQALALARQAQTAAPQERAAVLDNLDPHLRWLTARAADAPGNFAPMVRLLEAERTWATGDGWATVRAFDVALREVKGRSRPWQRALITERAARCHLAYDVEHVGHALLADARRRYADWGAAGKTVELERQYPFVRPSGRLRDLGREGSTTALPSEVIDMLGVLTASRALSSETSLDRLRARVTEVLGLMTGATAVQVLLHDDTRGWYLPEPTGDGMPLDEAGARNLVPLSLVRYVERTRESLVIDDVVRDDRFGQDPYVVGVECCSLLAVPILAQGTPRAMLLLENRLSRGGFTADRVAAVTLIAGQLAVSLDNAMVYASLERKVAERTEALAVANERLERLAVTDALTGLANRRRLTEVLDAEWRRALRPKTSLAVAMIDIDHFKGYNDHYGHAAGDECLRKVAAALASKLRETDHIARYGGEEFTIVLPDTDIVSAAHVAERVRANVQALAEPHAAAPNGIVTVSIGIATIVPTPYDSVENLIESADTHLYEAKRSGRNRVASEPAS